MTAAETLAELNSLLASNPPLELATAAKPRRNETQHDARAVPLDGDANAYFRKITTEAIESAHQNELRRLDHTYKPEAGTVEWAPLDDVPAVKAACERFADLNDLSNFTAGDDEYKKRLLYWVGVRQAGGPRAFFFRSFSQAAELKRKKFVAIVLRDGPFELLDEQVFLFDENVDCAVYGEYIFILRRNDYRRIFEQLEEIRQAALNAAQLLHAQVPIKNIQEFAAACAGQPGMADKLIAVQRRDYFPRLNYQMLAPVIAEFELPIEVDDSDGTPKLIFKPGVEDRWRILHLIDDDYLASSMTDHKYEVNSKTATA
jgi:hypothetical protein